MIVHLKTSNQIWTELSALTFLCLFTRVPWLFMVPMVEAPDEFSHFWVVKFLVEHAHLPTRNDVFSGGPSAVYGPLPQLGYLPHVLISKLLPFWDLTITARLGSLLMGVILVGTSYFIARELYGEHRLARLALPGLVLLHPQMVLLDAYINSDSTAVAAATLILLVAIRMIKNGLSLFGCSLIGCLAGLAALSKYTALPMVLASAFGLIAAGWLNGASFSLVVAACGTMISVMALTCSWWFMRELHEYPGDLLGSHTMRHIWAVTYNRPLVYKTSIWHVLKDFHHFWRPVFFSFWGMFGYMTRYLPKPFYWIYFFSVIPATTGGILNYRQVREWFECFFLKLRVKDNEDIPEKQIDSLKTFAIYTMFFLGVWSNLSAIIWSYSLNEGASSGRYLFPCEVPIMALIIGGLLFIGKKNGDKLVMSFVVFNLIVYVWSFVMLFQIYGGFRTKTF